MKELKVIGAEHGSLVLVSEDGERFAVTIDATLHSLLRPTPQPLANEKKIPPREIQALIRSGLTAGEVVELTGATAEFVERFEGPVIAEREHIVASALGIRVHTVADPDPLEEGIGFGDVIRERLASLDASGERWSSWKDESEGWIIKVEFVSDRIEHDARWSFDPKKGLLSPVNPQAITLSQQGEIRGTLIPRLRAVTPANDETAPSDTGRFNTDTFTSNENASADTAPQPKLMGAHRPDAARTDSTMTGPIRPETHERTDSTAPRDTTDPRAATGSFTTTGSFTATGSFQRISPASPAETRERDLAQTSDLLDALRRRRGEREAAVFSTRAEREAATDRASSETGELLLDPFDNENDAHRAQSDGAGSTPSIPSPAAGLRPAPSPSGHPSAGNRSNRRGRASMPSWDEIVFGARSDDDH